MSWFSDNLGKVGGTVLGGPIGFFAGNEYDKKRAQDRAREAFDPYSGQPGYAEYIGMDPAALELTGTANRIYGDASLDTRASDKFTNEALRPGRSTGAKLAMANNAAMAKKALDMNRGASIGMATSAKNNLAMKGGLSTGAAERINKATANNALDLTQEINANAAQQNRMIGMEDAGRKMSNLGQASGMALNNAGFNLRKGQGMLGTMEGDLNRKTAELARRNAFNMGKYQSDIGGWAAGKQAQATQNSGKK